MKKTIAIALLLASPLWAAPLAVPPVAIASSAEIHAALLAMRYPLLGAGYGGTTTVFSGAGAVFDPIVPADGSQGITGDLVVSGLVSTDTIKLRTGDLAFEDNNSGTIAAVVHAPDATDPEGAIGAARINSRGGSQFDIKFGATTVAAFPNAGGMTTAFPITSTLATGTAPLTVASTTVVTNLNADTLDGISSAGFQAADADLSTVAAIGSGLQQIRVNAGATGLEYFTPAASGDVVGPASSTDNAVPRYDGTTGKLLQDGSGVTISDSGVISDSNGIVDIGPVGGASTWLGVSGAATGTEFRAGSGVSDAGFRWLDQNSNLMARLVDGGTTASLFEVNGGDITLLQTSSSEFDCNGTCDVADPITSAGLITGTFLTSSLNNVTGSNTGEFLIERSSTAAGAGNGIIVMTRAATNASNVHVRVGAYSDMTTAGEKLFSVADNINAGDAEKAYVDLDGEIVGGFGSGNPALVYAGGTLSASSTAVGNVGAAGPDDLISYTLPALSLLTTNRGFQWKAWGTIANNANAKTLACLYGGQTVLTHAMTVSIAGTWNASGTVIRTGLDTQDWNTVYLGNTGTANAFEYDPEIGTGTVDDGASIAVKCQATASTSNNDIVQEGAWVSAF